MWEEEIETNHYFDIRGKLTNYTTITYLSKVESERHLRRHMAESYIPSKLKISLDVLNILDWLAIESLNLSLTIQNREK